MSVVKLQEEELQELKEIQKANNEIIVNLGALDLDINATEISLESLKERRKKLRIILSIQPIVRYQTR